MNIKCQLPFAVPSVAVRCRAESLCLSTYVVVLVYSVRYRLLFRHRAVCHYRCTVDLVRREAVAAETVRVAKEGTRKNLSDLFTKLLPQARREELLDKFTY